MPNWTESMVQTFEYWKVDPLSWGDVSQVDTVTNCSIDWDLTSDTLVTASIDLNFIEGEFYIRTYMITIQNGVTEKHPLGTFLIQTPSKSYDGKVKTVTVDAFSPLIELTENKPPIGYYIPKGTNIMEQAYLLTRENMRAPVIKTTCNEVLHEDFIADPDDNWLDFIRDLISNAKYELSLDEMGRVLFAPIQEIESLQPVIDYKDNSISIIKPEFDIDLDMYQVPNTVEITCSNGKQLFYHKVVNEDTASATSIYARGRTILYRETDPKLLGDPTQERIEEYAIQKLKELSTINQTISYEHGYIKVNEKPINIGDGVVFHINNEPDLYGVRGRVISQSITCEPGCPVSETAAYPVKLWR